MVIVSARTSHESAVPVGRLWKAPHSGAFYVPQPSLANVRRPDRLDRYTGLGVTIADNRGTWAHSGFCTDRLSQPTPNGDPAGVGGTPESLKIPFVLVGISVGKRAHRPVERVPGAEIAADRDRVA